MIIECNLWCFDADFKEKTGQETNEWLPFCFFMEKVKAFKMTTKEEGHFVEGMTTLFYGKENFVIDIKFEVFKTMHRKFHNELSKAKLN